MGKRLPSPLTELPERIVDDRGNILSIVVVSSCLNLRTYCSFFYYDGYCYLPLYIFSGEHLLCARLRTADQDASAGSKAEVERIVEQIRADSDDPAVYSRSSDTRARASGSNASANS